MTVRSSAALLAALVLAGCVAPANRAPAPRLVAQPLVPLVAPPAVPPAEAPVVQPGEDWRDIPLSAGGWLYRPSSGDATFGPPGAARFTARCDRTERIVTLARTGASGSALTIQTSSATRTLPAQPQNGADVASLRASDPFLDAIAFSRGRFVVTSPPAPRLVIPAWPEFARVVEDCRA